jgi:hypothetical protein
MQVRLLPRPKRRCQAARHAKARVSLLLQACTEQFDFPPSRRQGKGFYRLAHRELVDRLELDQQVSLIDDGFLISGIHRRFLHRIGLRRREASGLIALLVAFTFDLDQPQRALLTVFIVAQPQSGLVLAKRRHLTQ